jgi:hypothetical protein
MLLPNLLRLKNKVIDMQSEKIRLNFEFENSSISIDI